MSGKNKLSSLLKRFDRMSKIYLFILCLLPTLGLAQDVLHLEEAIAIALDQNIAIEVAALDAEAAEKGVYRSNAGFGPTLSLNANLSGTLANVNQRFIDGRQVKRFGRTIAPNANIALDWALYDGGRMNAILEQLRLFSEGAGLQSQLVIQDIVVQVMEAYFNIIQQNDRLAFLSTIINYYEERLSITEERWKVGRGSKLDFLQSKTDLNAQLAEAVQARNALKNAKVALNGILNRDLSLDFQIHEDSLTYADYDLENLIERATEDNRDLLVLQNQRNINLLTEKQIEAGRKPQLDFTSTLGYNYLNTNAGFLLSNQNASFNVGLRARWVIYDGDHLRNQLEISKLQTSAIEKQYDQSLQIIVTRLTNAYNQYMVDRELLTFERDNQALAEENLSISVEKFKLGDSTILEVNEAQRTYDTALNRLVTAEYSVRISELALLLLSGSLVR